MTTPVWQPSRLYPPGSLVQPATAIEPIVVSLDNAGFDDGTLSGWTFTGAGTKSVTTLNSHSGTYNLACDNGEVVGINDENPPANPGLSITASVQIRLSESGTSAGRVRLWWYDASDVLIGAPVDGNLVQKPGSRSERWVQSTVTAIAPALTASVKVGFWTNSGTGGGDTRVDTLAWNYSSASAPAGLIYKAVQAVTGYSGDAEPNWPLTNGVQVVDNQVTWEAIFANRVVWEASPIMLSGATEPAWPTTVGQRITDGTISWEVISRRVEDEKCPNSKVVAIIAGKVFAADRDIVRFSATANPLDWSTENDAGYLPTGLQQANANDMAVLNQYRSNLVAFNASSFQNWQADPDPAAMAILDQMDGIGSTWQQAAQPVSNELFYLSQLGVRTVGIAGGAENLAAGDVGMPIDPLVREALGIAGGVRPLATYYPSTGQYWLAMRAPLPVVEGPTISGTAPDALLGEAYSYSYATVAGDAPIDRTEIFSGNLLGGLTWDESTATISGTPAEAGTMELVLRTFDTNGLSGDTEDTISVTEYDPNITMQRYLLIDFGDSTDYSAPAFDDSAWDEGLLPLGTADRPDAALYGFPPDIATNWPLDKNAWFRGRLTLTETLDVELGVYLDDAAEVFVNGVSVFDHQHTVSNYYFTETVTADKFIVGENVIAIKCRADIFGINNYISYRMVAT